MIKSKNRKFRYFLFLFLTLLLVAGIYTITKNATRPQPNKDKPITSTPKANEPKDQANDVNDFIRNTFTLSEGGKLVNLPFISGKTQRTEVSGTWGKPTQITKAEDKSYEEYTQHHVVLGYEGDICNDIRSYDSKLQSIRYHNILKVGGDPDEVRYYKDETHDQIILVYHVTPAYDLKWIMPKPTTQEPNPKADHISLYTEVARQPSQQTTNQPKTISETIAKMSLSEKIGQMIIAGISGTSMNASTKSLIKKDKVGGIICYADNLVNPKQTVQLINQMKIENQANPLPLLSSVDQEGGKIERLPGGLTSFPTNKKIGAINNSSFSYQVGTLLGKELKAFGFNLDFAPVLDINSNPKNPVIGDRSFSNNPSIVSKLGIQTMKGIQSQKIIATIKHFPGHGDTSVDSHLDLPIVYKNMTDLNKLELVPFKQAINSGADVVMVAHILLSKLDSAYPASMSKIAITNILRKQLHFDGVVITDDMTMEAITDHYAIGKAAVESVKAGSDIILVAHDYNKISQTITSLKSAVQKGEISEQRINESVRRIIQLKRKYQISDSRVGNANITEINQEINQLLKKYVK
ncbi:beta-N-acetylhexosaminidase [Cytobacillus sp. Hz8]|uniref:beta-N-acetylhexosaminidase n=1 Tax=Cytobacillus sp. Hz8 TaxID=3347168 RepID=UPI0035D99BA0